MLKPHTGKRRRSVTAGEVASFAKRRRGTQKERDNLMQLYAPLGRRCPKCRGILKPLGDGSDGLLACEGMKHAYGTILHCEHVERT